MDARAASEWLVVRAVVHVLRHLVRVVLLLDVFVSRAVAPALWSFVRFELLLDLVALVGVREFWVLAKSQFP